MPTPAEIVLNALDEVLARWPQATSLLFERAKALATGNRDEEAEPAYHAVIALDPAHFRALNDLGLLYHRHGFVKEAEACFRAATEADPKNAGAAANLAYMLLVGDDLDGARAGFERALALSPGHLPAREGFIRTLQRLGLRAEAQAQMAELTRELGGATAERGLAPPVAPVRTDPLTEYVYEVAANAIVAEENEPAHAFLEKIVGDDPHYAGLLFRLADFAGSQRNYAAARRTFEYALTLDPDNPEVHIGLAIVHEEMGDLDAARAEWNSPLLRGAVRTFPFAGTGTPVRVLTIESALHSIRYELLLDPARMQNATLYTQAYAPDIPLPEHDVVLVAVADVESDARALEVARSIVGRTAAPVLNHPDRIARTSRAEQAERLGRLEGVATARVRAVARERLAAPDGPELARAEGFAFPFLLRSPGFHNGKFFELVNDAAELATVAPAMPTEEIMLMTYMNTAAADGTIRKFRVMSIDRQLYPVHLAISPNWKVHYISSAMRDNDAYRQEERAFLTGMTAFLGAPAVAALERVAAAMDLDYAGIDFTLDANGRVVVFEANGAMAIFAPDRDPRWDYRREPIARALDAAKQMILDRAQRG